MCACKSASAVSHGIEQAEKNVKSCCEGAGESTSPPGLLYTSL